MYKINDEVMNHYREEAMKFGDSSKSTMDDEIIRKKEGDFILSFLGFKSPSSGKVLDLGCGNGYCLEEATKKYIHNQYWGLDLNPDLLDIAKNRNLSSCKFVKSDARQLPFEDNLFDIIYTERCLINILDWDGQKKALKEIHRVIKPESYFLMIECFTDGLMNNNKARQECGLPPLKERFHNKYFNKEDFFKEIEGMFSLEELDNFQYNFLSSHYFISRVLHPLVTKGNQTKNTEFVKFFSFLPPIGNYSPLQGYIFKKSSH